MNKLKGIVGIILMVMGVVLPIVTNVPILPILGDAVFFSLVLIGAYLVRDAYF